RAGTRRSACRARCRPRESVPESSLREHSEQEARAAAAGGQHRARQHLMLEILLAGALLLSAGPQQRTDTTFSANGLNALLVENRNGATIVRGWDRNEVRIRAASRGQSSVDLDIDRRDGTVMVETDRGRPEVQYEIDVPARMAVD